VFGIFKFRNELVIITSNDEISKFEFANQSVM